MGLEKEDDLRRIVEHAHFPLLLSKTALSSRQYDFIEQPNSIRAIFFR